MEVVVPRDDAAVVGQRLIQGLRAALVAALSIGSWSAIEGDHRKVNLAWRADLEPGRGKPRYVERVLNALSEDELVGLGHRVLERLADRPLLAVEDALLWIAANGIAQVSEITRVALASMLDGHRLHPVDDPNVVLGRFGHVTETAFSSSRFEYGQNAELVEVKMDMFGIFAGGGSTQTITRANHLALLDAFSFRDWPDARLFQFLEFLVDPRVRRGEEQSSLVQILNSTLAADRFELVAGEQLSGHPVFKVRPAMAGVAGRPKNLIFASTGPKPELGFADAVNNDIVILRHAEHCLIYDEPIGDEGLRWTRLVEWWAVRNKVDPRDAATRTHLGERLGKSLASEPERRLFKSYFKSLRPLLGDAIPALIPQVYLHYDPMTLRELRERGDTRRFEVQRMDFLLLLPHGVRVIVEVDGQQHYSTGMDASAKPSPEEYARTARADRHLRLAGYEVYRFGGYELRDENLCGTAVLEFFLRLFRRHKLLNAPLSPR